MTAVEDTAVRRCEGPHRLRDGEELPPAPSGLCDGCRGRVRRALEDLPELYTHLYLALEPGAGALRERSGGSKERALVFRTDVEQLMRDVCDTVLTWASLVRDVAGLSDQHARRLRPSNTVTGATPRVAVEVTFLACDVHSREVQAVGHELERQAILVRQAPRDSTRGPALGKACEILTAHLSTLVALDTHWVARSVPQAHLEHLDNFTVVRWIGDDGALVAVETTGLQAALQILDLQRRAQRTLGHTRGKDRLSDMACPACSAAALVRWHGSDRVECEACGETWAQQDWTLLTATAAAAAGKAPRTQHRTVPRRDGDYAAGGGVVPGSVHHAPDYQGRLDA